MSRSVPEATQKAAWGALQESNRKIKESRDKVLAWATATTGPSSTQEGSSQGKGGPDPDNEEISPYDEDNEFRPSVWSDLLASWAREPRLNDDVIDKVTD